jgi:hypothetical protein
VKIKLYDLYQSRDIENMKGQNVVNISYKLLSSSFNNSSGREIISFYQIDADITNQI